MLPVDPIEYEKHFRDPGFAEEVARELVGRSMGLSRTTHGSNVVFQLANGNYLKLFPPFESRSYRTEALALPAFFGLSVSTPRLVRHGEITTNPGWTFLEMTGVAGLVLEEIVATLSEDEKCALLIQIGALMREVHTRVQLPTDSAFIWSDIIATKRAQVSERHRRTGLPQVLLNSVEGYVEAQFELITSRKQRVVLTGEYDPENLLIDRVDGAWRVCGLIDFGDTMIGDPEYDLLGPMLFMAAGNVRLLQALLYSYGYMSADLTEEFRARLMTLFLLHRFSNVGMQLRMDGWQSTESIEELARRIWAFERA